MRTYFSNRFAPIRPRLASVFRAAISHWHSRRFMGKKPAIIFTDIFKRREWGGEESASGTGSTQNQTAGLRAKPPEFLRDLAVDSLLDAPCGDYFWMRLIDLPIKRYMGIDIVPALIESNCNLYSTDRTSFRCVDLILDSLPPADFILCRDYLVHFSYRNIWAAFRNFKASGAKYLATTTFPSHTLNTDCFAGHWRPLNLQCAPFFLPEPDHLMIEG